MEFKKIFGIGLKIVAAAVVGIAAFAGINQVFNNDQEHGRGGCSENNDNCGSLENNNTEDNSKQQVMEGLRKTQNAAGKFVNVVQSITMVADSLFRMFDKNASANNTVGYGGYGYQQPQYYVGPGYNAMNNPYQNPWVQQQNMGMQQPLNMGNGQPNWSRVDENIVEAH